MTKFIASLNMILLIEAWLNKFKKSHSLLEKLLPLFNQYSIDINLFTHYDI